MTRKRHDLSKPVQARLCHDRHALERSQVFRPARSPGIGGPIVKNATTKPVRCAI
jgi:hypothetical protein